MRKTWHRWLAGLLLGALLAVSTVVGQESVDPIQVGGGATSTRMANGQTVEVTAAGVSAYISFTEFSSQRIAGHAQWTGQGPGTVTIHWVNRNRQIVLTLSPNEPDKIFGMENGDVDKRSGDNGVTNPNPNP